MAVASIALMLASAAPAAGAPVIAAAGDIACPATAPTTPTRCHQQATADLLSLDRHSAVLPLGDNQYDAGSLGEYQSIYEPSWGKVKSITRPVPGGKEYTTGAATGYFDYFGAAAGPRDRGYYSFDIGGWHLIALNTNCNYVDCARGAPQERWLQEDLATHPATCTLAYMYTPRFSSGPEGGYESVADLWSDLYFAGTDVVLASHDHLYERFAPQNAAGTLDPTNGVRQFVVGTGGRSHYDVASIRPNSEVRNSDTFGVLELTLERTSYSWRFIPEAGGSFSDTGAGLCQAQPNRKLLKLSGPVRLKGRTLRLFGRCARACTVQARAGVRIGKAKKRIKSRRLRRALPGAKKKRLVIKLSRSKAQKVRRALKRHRKVRAKIDAFATDRAGKAGVAHLRKRVRRASR